MPWCPNTLDKCCVFRIFHTPQITRTGGGEGGGVEYNLYVCHDANAVVVILADFALVVVVPQKIRG